MEPVDRDGLHREDEAATGSPSLDQGMLDQYERLQFTHAVSWQSIAMLAILSCAYFLFLPHGVYFEILLLTGCVAVAVAMLVLLFAAYPAPLEERCYEEGYCLCGYDLTGNVSGVCPECGEPNSSTPKAPSREQKRTWVMILFAGSLWLWALVIHLSFIIYHQEYILDPKSSPYWGEEAGSEAPFVHAGDYLEGWCSGLPMTFALCSFLLLLASSIYRASTKTHWPSYGYGLWCLVVLTMIYLPLAWLGWFIVL